MGCYVQLIGVGVNYWVCVGCLLVACWLCVGCALVVIDCVCVCWLRSGCLCCYVLVAYVVLIGCAPGCYVLCMMLCIGCLLVAHCVFDVYGLFMDFAVVVYLVIGITYWLFVGYVLFVCCVCIGCLVVINWLTIG